jgi:hypothetical protein
MSNFNQRIECQHPGFDWKSTSTSGGMKPAGIDAMPPWGVNIEDAMDLSFPLESSTNEQMTPCTSWHDIGLPPNWWQCRCGRGWAWQCPRRNPRHTFGSNYTTIFHFLLCYTKRRQMSLVFAYNFCWNLYGIRCKFYNHANQERFQNRSAPEVSTRSMIH